MPPEPAVLVFYEHAAFVEPVKRIGRHQDAEVSDSLEASKTGLERVGEANDRATAKRSRRMSNITRDTGEFLSVLVRATLARRVLEVATVAPVFANLRHNKRLDRFTLRSGVKVNAQWRLYCPVHNIEKLAHHGYARSHGEPGALGPC